MARCALITGAGSGIGAALARRLTADGWQLGLVGRRPEPLQALAQEGAGMPLPADTAHPEQIESAVAALVERHGRLDALVCSAGIGASGKVGEQTLERWNRVIATNLTGAFLACRASLPHLLEHDGAVVTISSLAGLRTPPASAAYAASKAGLIQLTRSMAFDYGPLGVRANCVCPGWIRTDMADGEMDALAAQAGTNREGAYGIAAAAVPTRRPGRPEEVAGTVAWLLSPDAGYMNGAVIVIDGGAAIVDVASLPFARELGTVSAGAAPSGAHDQT
jgi:meso-butanediol dehydrogenase / (S,S)-butanediol dehydrogenase / diacetyl reductase